VAGCRQFVRHGVEGFVVAPGEPEALARELARLAGDPQLRARMGAAARQRVLQDYSELAVRTKFREIYRDACGPARPPSTVSGRGAARPLRLGMKVSTKA
jgi:glycosyltransferase involved in cell wall biosynthesis